MLPKHARIVREKDIKDAFRTKVHYNTTHMRFWMTKGGEEEFQLLVIISKKVFKKANKRFRCKRRINGIFVAKRLRGELPKHTRCIIQILKKDMIRLSTQELEEEINTAMNNLIPRLTNKQNNYKIRKQMAK